MKNAQKPQRTNRLPATSAAIDEVAATFVKNGAAQVPGMVTELWAKLTARRTRSEPIWRLTPEETNRLDGLTTRLRNELGVAQLDRATMLSALTALAAESPVVFGELAERIRADRD